MKLNFLIVFFATSAILLYTACTKDKVVEKVVNTETGIHLLDFNAAEQPNHLSTVTITWADNDTSSTSYHTQLYKTDSSQAILKDTTVFEKEVSYSNVSHNLRYRHKIFSIPRNDSLIITFLIGTMGDVDIRTE
ncbi:MAG: hypothetical protein JWN78_427 [Bacteroidota bacterium]|nr:hypothetical protein [Bacteroidota bacterium]